MVEIGSSGATTGLAETTKDKVTKSVSESITYLMDEWKKKLSEIEIPTYYKFNFRNLHRRDPIYNWLYPWDVTSGCIWKKDAIKSIKKIS